MPASELRRLKGYREPSRSQLAELGAWARSRHPASQHTQDAEVFRVLYSRRRLKSTRRWIEAFVHIKAEDGRIIPIRLNYPQRYALAQILKEGRKRECWVDRETGVVRFQRQVTIEDGEVVTVWRDVVSGVLTQQLPAWVWSDLERAPGPIMVIILKARQEGMSTLIQALNFEAMCRGHNVAVKLVSHADESAGEILQMPGRMLDEFQERWFAMPVTRRSDSEGVIELGAPFNAKITTSTAQAKKDPARGSTYQRGHFTEVGDWEPIAYDLMTALLQILHPVPDSAVIVESTAKGAQGWFYEQWRSAEEGRSEYLPIFLPWFWLEKYRRDGATPSEIQGLRDSLNDPRWNEGNEESWLLEQTYYRPGRGYVKVDYQQLAWRRWCIDNKCGGRLDKFHQEYPSYPQQAFLKSGRPVFDQHLIEKRLRSELPPLVFHGDLNELDFQLIAKDHHLLDWFEEHHDLEHDDRYGCQLVTRAHGPLRIWKKPAPRHSYGLAADTSEGVDGGDPSCLYVQDFETAELVCEWHGYTNPKILARIAARLGWWYNQALVAPEKNNHGYAMLLELVDVLLYPNLYEHRQRTKIAQPTTENLGFVTTPTTRKNLFDHFRLFFRENPDFIPSRELLLEMQGMTYNTQDREVPPARGADGQPAHDDRVLACGIVLQVREEAYRLGIVEKDPEPEPNDVEALEWRRVDALYDQFRNEDSRWKEQERQASRTSRGAP